MHLLNRLRCWMRNEHRYMVPDLALIAGGANLMNVYPGECCECGAVRYQTAKRWQEVRRPLSTEETNHAN